MEVYPLVHFLAALCLGSTGIQPGQSEMTEPEPGGTPPRIVAESDTSLQCGLQRWIYIKATARAARTLTGRHLLLKARKVRLPLDVELVQMLELFGEVEDITLARSGAFLYVTYNESSAAIAAREGLSENTAASVLLGCGDRCRGATVHFCNARDVFAEADAEAARVTQQVPDGLHLLDDFLSPSEELGIVKQLQYIEWGTNAGHRRVAHFGHTFNYASRSVDFVSEPPALPEWTEPLLDRLRERVTALPGLSEWIQPDQLTVNEYQPGQGIAAHVETHSAFENVLLGISLHSGVTMDFRNCELRATRSAQAHHVAEQATEKGPCAASLSADVDDCQEMEECSVWLPPRSLLVLSGSVRYGWSHGIAHRMTEQRDGKAQTRGLRYSLTFRKVRPQGHGCHCQFPRCCDARSVRSASVGRHGQDNRSLQQEYVEHPARALLAWNCKRRQFPEAKRESSRGEHGSTDVIDLLLPPQVLRPQAGPASDCARISQWVDCTCGSDGGASGAFVAVLGSCYGGIPGLDKRSPGVPSSLPVGGGYGWFGCHPVQSYVKQLSSRRPGNTSPSAVVTASFNLDSVSDALGHTDRKTSQLPLLPIRSEACDVVVALGVLDQLSTAMQRERFVVEALRLLRPPQGRISGGEACFEVLAAPPRQQALTHDCAADLLVPVRIKEAGSPGATGRTFHEVFFHLFADGELEELVKGCASQMAPGLEIEFVWSAQQRGGGTHACAVRRVR